MASVEAANWLDVERAAAYLGASEALIRKLVLEHDKLASCSASTGPTSMRSCATGELIPSPSTPNPVAESWIRA